MSWFQTKKASKLPSLDRNKILVFDTETTGLEPSVDEILQITILNGYGDILFDSYIKPKRHKHWPVAKAVNHISYDMVKNAPTFSKVRKDIQEIFNNATLILGYNIDFDINFVEAAGIIVSGTKFDVMTAFASYRAGIEGSFYRTCKLEECAEYFNYSFAAHDSTEDARATLYCFNEMVRDSRFTTFKRKEKKELREELKTASTPKKKTRFSIKMNTHRRWPLAIKGVLILIIGVIVYSFVSDTIISDLQIFRQAVIYAFQRRPLNYIECIAVVLMSLGATLTVAGIIKFIIKTPKWIAVQIKRIANRF